jgi:cell division septation protein DedD
MIVLFVHGRIKSKEKAQDMVDKLKKVGFDAIIKNA